MSRVDCQSTKTQTRTVVSKALKKNMTSVGVLSPFFYYTPTGSIEIDHASVCQPSNVRRSIFGLKRAIQLDNKFGMHFVKRSLQKSSSRCTGFKSGYEKCPGSCLIHHLGTVSYNFGMQNHLKLVIANPAEHICNQCFHVC